jgi:hypothetical protein
MGSHVLRTLFRTATLACAVGATHDTAAAARALIEVDLELVLAVDVSRSVDLEEHQVQRAGYIAAFRHPDIVQAIESGRFGRIAVIYFEWAGPHHQSVAVPWTIVGDRADAMAFADRLAAQPILPEAGTSISASLTFAEQLFPVSGAQGLRRVIDVSGDGANNDGPPLSHVRLRLIAEGITINGLAIELGGPGEIADYFETNVIGGPGAFTITVEDQSGFCGGHSAQAGA